MYIKQSKSLLKITLFIIVVVVFNIITFGCYHIAKPLLSLFFVSSGNGRAEMMCGGVWWEWIMGASQLTTT